MTIRESLEKWEEIHLSKYATLARLNKGYWVEGAGANREYVTGQDVNMRSLKK